MLLRVAPFAIFLILTACQGMFGAAGAYWFYVAKTLLGVAMVMAVWPLIEEMRWRFSWEAVVVGVAVCVMWVGLDGITPKLFKPGEAWNPNTQFGQGTPLAWCIIAVRLLGSTFVVPPLEEVFYRSFLYRYVAKPDFQSVALGVFKWTPFLVTAVIFGFTHNNQWLAGILCGFAYQGLVCWKKRLGDAMTAHAITNFLLGIWVVWQNDWKFW